MKIIIDPEYKATLTQEQLNLLDELKDVDVNEIIPDEEIHEENILPMESD